MGAKDIIDIILGALDHVDDLFEMAKESLTEDELAVLRARVQSEIDSVDAFVAKLPKDCEDAFNRAEGPV